MNAVYFNTRGGPEALVYGAAAMPRAGEGEIVVRVRAAAVTPTELLWVPTWTTRASKPFMPSVASVPWTSCHLRSPELRQS